FTAIFVGLVVVVALLVLFKPENKGAATGLTWVAALVGLVDVFVMASIYSTTSAPIWQGNATFVEFYAATISIGAVLFLLFSLNEAVNMGKIVALATVSIVVIQVAVVVPYFVAAGSSSSIAWKFSQVWGS
ncbi:MAG: DmsC/YnfH family molybdoenzyme membrane anchor subunit, partial [Bacillota bacterium]